MVGEFEYGHIKYKKVGCDWHEPPQEKDNYNNYDLDIMQIDLRNECLFSVSWGMNLSPGQTNHVNREAVRGPFVCSALRFIPHEVEPRK